jgi:hypothetical protein
MKKEIYGWGEEISSMDYEEHVYPATCPTCGATYQSEEDEGTHIEKDTGNRANWAVSVCEKCYDPSLKERLFSDIDKTAGEMEEFLLGHAGR